MYKTKLKKLDRLMLKSTQRKRFTKTYLILVSNFGMNFSK